MQVHERNVANHVTEHAMKKLPTPTVPFSHAFLIKSANFLGGPRIDREAQRREQPPTGQPGAGGITAESVEHLEPDARRLPLGA